MNIPDDITYANMSQEQRAVVCMWQAVGLPVQWRMDQGTEWHNETNQSSILRALREAEITNSNSPVWHSYYRLKPSE